MLFLRRSLIFLSLLSILALLEFNSSESLLLNLPSKEDVLASIIEKEKQLAEIPDLISEAQKRDNFEDYTALFDDSIRHTFIIEFTQEEWNGLLDDMISYNELYGSYRSNHYRDVTITYITPNETRVFENVGFRSKGNVYSRWLPDDGAGNVRDIHFMLKFNETFDYVIGTDEYNDLKSREFATVENLLFKMNNTNDPSYTNEIYSLDMMREAGVIVPEASYAEVRIVIDGRLEKVSLYNIFESFDEEFVRRYFNQDLDQKEIGNLYKMIFPATLEPITDLSLIGIRDWENNIRPIYGLETNKIFPDYNDLIDFTLGINIADDDIRQQYFETYFDIDSFLKQLAITTLVGNPDDYRANLNNYYMYFDKTGYATYLPFDYDNSMGSGWGAEPIFTNYTIDNDIYDWGFYPNLHSPGSFTTPLTDNIFAIDEYRIKFEDYLDEYISTGLFSSESYNTKFTTAFNLYSNIAYMYNDKDAYIEAKINAVEEDLIYYRSLR